MLQVRAAYGETGNQPLYAQKFTPLVFGTIDGQPGILNGGVAGEATSCVASYSGESGDMTEARRERAEVWTIIPGPVAAGEGREKST